MRRCDNCRFHYHSPDHCRLDPPVFIDKANSHFRLVRPEWWCGKHKLSFWKFIRNIFRRSK